MDKPLGNPPAELKSLLPFVQRANELRVADPVIAYWCCYYGAQLGISANAKERDAKLYLLDLMDTLEALKAQLMDNDAVVNDAASSAYVENFALKVFVGADNEDRAGKATRGTAKKFLIASQFLELLKIFGSVEPEMQEKIRYAKWKAADIAKAFKEGRTPRVGPADGDEKEDTAGIESAMAPPPVDSKVEEEYLAREMAKLVAPDLPSAPADSSSLAPEVARRSPADRAAAPNMSRSPSASKVHLGMDGGAVSPNFSKPLQPQMPRSSSFGGDVGGDDSSVPLPKPSAAAAGEGADTWEHAVMGHSGLAANTDRSDDDMFPRSPNHAPAGVRPMPSDQIGLPTPPSNLPNAWTQDSGPGTASSSFWADPDTEAHDTSSLPSVPSNMPDSTSAANFDHPAIQRIDPDVPKPGSRPSYDQVTTRGVDPILPSAPDFQDADKAPDVAVKPTVHQADAPQRAITKPLLSQTAIPAQRPRETVAPLAPTLAENFPDALSARLSTRVQKLAKGAASAVDFDDLDTARVQLRQALDILEGRVTK